MIDFDDFDAEMEIAESSFPKTEKLPEVDAEPESNLGLFEGISNEEYHSGRGISSSSLKYAVKAMPVYQAHLQGKISFQESEAMRLGTAVHKMVLESYDFDKEIIVSPVFERGKYGQIAKKEFEIENAKMTVITPAQYDKCRFMSDNILSLPDADAIFRTGKPELSGYYVDSGGDNVLNGADDVNHRTNMLCKYRPDWRTDWCLADVKTTRDITSQMFSKTIHNLGYHISAAHYLEGDRILTGTEHETFVFLCVEPEPPYLACMYVLDEDSLELGKEQRRIALISIKKARDTGEYPLYNNGLTQKIGVPQYAFYDSLKSKI